jgi:hypothetical protein
VGVQNRERRAALLVELPEATRLATHWQRLAELMLSAAQYGGLIGVPTDQLKMAVERLPPDGVPTLVEEDLEKRLAKSRKRRLLKKAGLEKAK